MLAPLACSRRAVSAPMRCAAPVMSTTRPSRFSPFSTSLSVTCRENVNYIRFSPECSSMSRFPQGRSPDLPVPPPEALAASARLHARICAEAQGGPLSFARYMELALYASGCGYYTGGSRKFGEAGDFVTAPEISPLFSWTLARQSAEVLAAMGGGDVLEFGAGTGALMTELLRELERLDSMPQRY